MFTKMYTLVKPSKVLIQKVKEMKKETKDCILSTRVTRSKKEELARTGASLNEVIDFYLINHGNEEIEDMVELKGLLEDNDKLANQIVTNNIRIEEIKTKHNIKGENKDIYSYLFNKDIVKAINKTLDYYNKWNKKGKATIEDFIEFKSDYINLQASKVGKNIEEFKQLLLEKVYEDKQQKLEI